MSFFKKLGFITFLLMSVVSYAAEPESGTIEELLVLSGTKSQAYDMLGAIEAIIEGRSGVSVKPFKSDISAVINPDKLLKDIGQKLEKELTEEEAKELIQWYSSNLGNRIASAEEAAMSPDTMMAIQKQAASLSKDTSRMDLSKKIVDASGFIEKSMDHQTLMAMVGEVVVARSKGASEQVDLEMVKKLIEQQSKDVQAQLENFLIIMIAYTYRDFSVEEIDEYINALKSPAMKKFNRLGQEATMASLEDTVKALSLAK